ncbi:hypothetical protein BKA67DRAFT_541996 [Truncatella angustata]|uniref:BTB domain-containing protein n=1 Tax=Truncatella angustata TaxID=152316 RepID=A0A9P8UBV8_9PEZI|nr:uncharacterized protein BKA67DRAFT_541996 [Truncatella angustata]KAH6645007.1 hypothetical protein BKA67DRAFT_541996 [Truncatella angustata]KAH8201059.1 hypothetical protein TruAng_004755 [Truncatella angustata]
MLSPKIYIDKHSTAAAIGAAVTEVPSHHRSFHEDGDLELHVGTGTAKTSFQVSSLALSQASRVWKRMLYGSTGVKWVDSKPSNGSERVVKLEEDNVGAMEQVLAWLHYDYDYEPEQPDVTFLYELTTLIDYYDLFKVVKPMMTKWNSYLSCLVAVNGVRHLTAWNDKDYQINVELDVDLCNRPAILWVAWAFGRQDIIDTATTGIIKTYKLNEQGDLVNYNNQPFAKDKHLYEVDLEAAIPVVRLQVIEKMLFPYRRIYDELSRFPISRTKDEFHCMVGHSRKSRELCEDKLLGSLVKWLRRVGWTHHELDNVYEHHMSVDAIYHNLASITLCGCESSWRDHWGCNPNTSLRAALVWEHNIVPSVLSSEEKEKLKKRRELWNYKLIMDSGSSAVSSPASARVLSISPSESSKSISDSSSDGD